MKPAIIIITMILFLSCTSDKDSKRENKKPAGLPESSFHIGHNWFLIHSVHGHKNSAFISVYNDDGILIKQKRFFVICRIDRPVTVIDNLQDQIAGFDGTNILLKAPTRKENCWME